MAKVELSTLARSSVVAWLAEAWRIGSRLILTPIIWSQLGKDGAGVWVLVFSLTNLVSMVNASFGIAYTKATAECFRSGDKDRLERVLGSGMLTIGGIALVAMLLFWLLGARILGALEVPASWIPDAHVALLLVMFALVLRMSFGCAIEVLSGLQRVDLQYRLAILASVIEFCISVPLLLTGGGLVGMGIAFTVGQAISIALAFLLARKHAPGLRISPLLWSKAGVREVFSIGGRFQLLGIVTTLVTEGVKFLMSKMLGVSWVAIYDLCDKLLTLGKSVSSSVLAPLMPAFADLQAGGEQARERALFTQSSKALALLSCGAFTFIAVLAHPVLLAWTGETVADAAIAVQLLVIGEVVMLQTGVVSANLRARGMVRMEFTCAMVSITIVLVTVYPLVQWLDFQGIVIARLLSQTVAALWYMRAYFRWAQLPWTQYVSGAQLPRVVAVVGIAGAVTLAGHLVLAPLLGGHVGARLAAVIEVMVLSVPYTLLLIGGILRWALGADEKAKLGALVQRKLGKLRNRG